MCQQQPCKYQMKNPTWLIELHKNVLRKEYDKPKWEHSASNIKIKNAQKNYKYSTNANSKVMLWSMILKRPQLVQVFGLPLTLLPAPGAGL